ncbi:MAG: MFS transporter [Dehalococcoidia bacterium]
MPSSASSRLPQKWRTLIAVGFGTFMATMDFSIVNVALPTFSREFDRSPDTVVWAALGSSLVVTGLTLTAGRAGDLYGRKRVYLAGWVILTLALTAASFAQSLEQIIALRLLQAVGVSLAIANANAIVTDAFPDTERGRALGTITSIVGAGLMSGPILGGLILELLDWRAIFYARIPIGLLAIAMGYLEIREEPRERDPNRRLDLPGAVLLFASLASVLVAVNRGQTWGWTSPVIIGLTVLGLVSLVTFLRVESRVASPILSLTLFRMRTFASSISSLTLNFVGQSSVIFLMPFYLIEVRDFSTAQTGLMIAMVPLMMLVFAPLSGWFADRTGWPHQATLGIALVSAGLLTLATLEVDTPVPLVLVRLALVGLGSMIFGPPNTSAVMGSVPRPMLGTASASVATSRNVGNAVGLAVASAVLVIVGGGAGAGIAANDLPPEDLLRGIRAAFLAAGLLSLLAIGASLTGRRDGPKQPPQPESARTTSAAR